MHVIEKMHKMSSVQEIKSYYRGSEFCILKWHLQRLLLPLGLMRPKSTLLLAWIHNHLLLLAKGCDPVNCLVLSG